MSHATILYHQPASPQANSMAESGLKNDTFPLVVCIGREPNFEGMVNNQVGAYSYRSPTNVWRTPKAMLGLCTKLDINKLIQKHGKSPIVHTDISPLCIKNLLDDKNRIRRSGLSLRMLADHVDRILSFEDLWRRTKIVIFTGIDKNVPYSMRAAKDELEDRLKNDNKQLQVLDLPFFTRFNKSAILLSIRRKKYQHQYSALSLVVRGFIEWCESQ